MPRFTKEIVRAGVYEVADEQGNRREEEISEDRIRHWARTHHSMRQAGLNIPAPTTHSLMATPNLPLDEKGKPRVGKIQYRIGQEIDSFTNGGFWSEMWNEKRPFVDPETGETRMVETLMGSLEVPDEFADKIGTVVKETSIFAPPKFKDGKGKVWDDAIVHAALVVNPIEPGQANFQPAGGLALAMSHFIRPLVMATPTPKKGSKKPNSQGYTANDDNDDFSDDSDFGDDFGQNPDVVDQNLQVPAGSATMQDAVAELRKCGLEVGDDATPQNFLERLILAARQKALTEGSTEDDKATNPLITEPEGGKKQPAAIAMSTQTKVTPEIAALQQQNALLMSIVHHQYQDGTMSRIQALIDSGKITKEQADAHFVPLLPTVKMSMGADNKPLPNELDRLIAFAESIMPAPQANLNIPGFGNVHPQFAQALAMSHRQPPNATREANADQASAPLSQADAAKLADSLAEQAGFVCF